MAAIRDIKRHIKAVQSLRQMTHALTQVAGARARRYRIQLAEAWPYAQGLERAMSLLTLRHGLQHPLLSCREVGREIVVAIGSERGLCGAHNLEVLQRVRAMPRPQPGVKRDLLVVGSKLAETCASHGMAVSRAVTRPRWGYAEEIDPLATQLTVEYLQNSYQSATTVGFSRDVSGNKSVTMRALLPVRPATAPVLSHLSPEIEPGSIDLLEHLVPRFIRSQLRVTFLQSMALEEEARALAMQSATTNATELLDGLTRRYRRARQDRITSEILEVIATTDAGAAA
ncbi:F0F1 ATP synthase subunit gamma [Candidatus Fermentibacteria bacterium]|nr:F0F1 ATP synthase subunit gamma [Candidatus Fermentibacteria bacterium]